MTEHGLLPGWLEPSELVVSRREAFMHLGGLVGFLGCIPLIVLADALRSDALFAFALLAPIVGITVLNVLTKRIGHRFRPGRIGALDRFMLESRLGRQWVRPDVVARSMQVARGA